MKVLVVGGDGYCGLGNRILHPIEVMKLGILFGKAVLDLEPV